MPALGRKPLPPSERTSPVSLALPRGLIEEIDRLRQGTSRSAYIVAVLRVWIDYHKRKSE